MKAVKITDDVYWVGGIDWNLRNFHGYLTQRGTTYNAYLVIDEKITLIDTVKHYLADEMLQRISDVVDPAKIEVVIANHVEMDHSGSLPVIKKCAPDAQIVCSPKGAEGLAAHYGKAWDFQPVKSGDTLSVGRRIFNFVTTPMVHWPDNMVTYSGEDKLLFSNDAFGQHIASAERFDDQYQVDIILEEARKYYANIVLPYGAQVQKALDAAAALDIRTICPSHGLVWRKYIPAILEKYKKWCSNTTDNRAVVVYDTMWHSTEKIAQAVARGFEAGGVPADLYNLSVTHISDIMTRVMEAKYICVGSPTLNNNMMPTVASFLTYLKGLSPKKRTGLAFGSFGWGGQSVGQVEEVLQAAWCDHLLDKIAVKYIPGDAALATISEQVTAALR